MAPDAKVVRAGTLDDGGSSPSRSGHNKRMPVIAHQAESHDPQRGLLDGFRERAQKGRKVVGVREDVPSIMPQFST